MADEESLRKAGKTLVELAQEFEGCEFEGSGIYVTNLYLASNTSALMLVSYPIATTQKPVNRGLKDLSQEYALRLAADHIADPNIVSSSQTRNQQIRSNTGAVLFRRKRGSQIYSIAGFEPITNEAIALVLGTALEDETEAYQQYAHEIAHMTGNDVFRPLLETYNAMQT